MASRFVALSLLLLLASSVLATVAAAAAAAALLRLCCLANKFSNLSKSIKRLQFLVQLLLRQKGINIMTTMYVQNIIIIIIMSIAGVGSFSWCFSRAMIDPFWQPAHRL